jgi:GntR family transcriptional regulator
MIRTGTIPAGHKLPSNAQLMEQYGVAYQTARQAIAVLKAEGLVEGRTGAGVFVRDRPHLIRLGADRYSRRVREGGQASFQYEAEQAGLTWRQEILDLATVPAPDWVADGFEIEHGTEVFVRRRRTWLEGEPTQLADSYYELAVVEGTAIMEELTGPGGSYARLEERGHRLTRFREELSSRMPTPEEVRGLQLRPGVTVVELHRIAFTGARPIEIFCSIMAGDRHTFSYEFEAPE